MDTDCTDNVFGLSWTFITHWTVSWRHKAKSRFSRVMEFTWSSVVAIALRLDYLFSRSLSLSPLFLPLQSIINVTSVTRHSTVTVYFSFPSIISYHWRWSILDITSRARVESKYTSVYEQNSFAYKTLTLREAICAPLSFSLCAIEIILRITVYRRPSVFVTCNVLLNFLIHFTYRLR